MSIRDSKIMVRVGLLCFLILIICSMANTEDLYKTDKLKIAPLSKGTFIHTSFLETKQWGKVSSNGLVYINNGEAIVFDTPANDSASAELINWIEGTAKAEIKAVIINHFHEDCLSGLDVFHGEGIQSYASGLTIELTRADSLNGLAIPKNAFEKELNLRVGNKIVVNKYFGEGHTRDNIVSYIPSEKVLFGGCLIKELGAKEGNLADANVKEWAKTVSKVKKAFPDLKYVVPGHGNYGDEGLLDYTIRLFSK